MTDKEHKYMFWIDLETTGSELDTNAIIEVGAAITDMRLNVLDARTYTVNPGPFVFELSDVVREMHTKNGLLAEIYDNKKAFAISQVDEEIADWIRKYNGSNHMAFAGSGVSHFDRQFIKRDMPLTNKRLTHWAIDVGVLRRVFHYFLQVPGWPTDTKNHRALSDVYFHIEEMRWALDRMRLGVV